MVKGDQRPRLETAKLPSGGGPARSITPTLALPPAPILSTSGEASELPRPLSPGWGGHIRSRGHCQGVPTSPGPLVISTGSQGGGEREVKPEHGKSPANVNSRQQSGSRTPYPSVSSAQPMTKGGPPIGWAPHGGPGRAPGHVGRAGSPARASRSQLMNSRHRPSCLRQRQRGSLTSCSSRFASTSCVLIWSSFSWQKLSKSSVYETRLCCGPVGMCWPPGWSHLPC